MLTYISNNRSHIYPVSHFDLNNFHSHLLNYSCIYLLKYQTFYHDQSLQTYPALVTLVMKPTRNDHRLYHRSSSAKNRSVSSQPDQNLSMANNIRQTGRSSAGNNSTANKGYLFGLNNVQMGRAKRNSAKITNKSIQQLFDENMKLRKENHLLAEQVAQLKGKFQAHSRNDTERGKELDLEFQKQLYWGGSKTHLISGIKHQYQKLQKKYQQLNVQCNQLKIELFQTKQPENRIYIETLQAENKRLSQKIMKLTSYPIHSDRSKKASEVILAQLNQQAQKLKKQLNQASALAESLQQEIRQKEKKALFLEKLLIEKDNAQYQGLRKIKKMDKAIEELKSINKRLNIQIAELQKKHHEDLIKRSRLQDGYKQRVRQQSKKEIEQLRNKIAILLEDKSELENTINKMKMSSSMLNSGGSIVKLADKRSQISINKGNLSKKQENIDGFKLMPTNMANSIENSEEQLFNGYESEVESETQKQKKPRVMRTADKRHSYLSKKLRKVQNSEVVEIAQLVKLRMIAADINMDQMKKYFDRDKSQASEDIEWDEEHIKFSQAKSILLEAPFKLEDQLAYLLARYLIEDCHEQYVYCDQANQNKREIVKSIMKTLVGNYSLSDEESQRQIEDFKRKYLQNFYSALKTYYPQGKVGRKKFSQILINMGTQLSDRSVQIIVARVMDKSANLLELQYNALLEL